ncbi:MAG: hypothetical protein JWO06_3198, partial [Bacteroidota bacterium]|nr:hypothetical protein [Bacteroidota bacterium]
MQTREAAEGKIIQLVERFEEQKEFYRRSEYNETLTRKDFIDPFFKALGWDMDNENGYAESYREVIHEDRLKIGGATKAPDYAFRLGGGKRLFFVEAKKPSVFIRNEIAPAYQVRRYGWNAKLPISIITDFEEFAIYDCTKKPNITDKAATARIKYFTYADYLGEFDFIWDTFSKEKVLKGSFDKFVQNDAYKKGTATVDNDFLQSLDKWRIKLATTISKNNKHLNEDEINFAVLQTIDRIIFLRIAEDRSIEPYGNMKDCIKQGNLYQNLFHLFTNADAKYNSGLFDFGKDKISRNLTVDNTVIRSIINDLYYPQCPYEFAYLPVEILGTAYERFLGKQIKIDANHKVTIEDKPEVRKAGGVYYTPQYIVEYIIKNTVGKLIEGKTPKEISKIKIADPACGSGSFLLGAYTHLLDYHKNYYHKNHKMSKGHKNHPLTPHGHLTTDEKKRILLNNIYGVDIDVNAVEVTKLSLLVKCMEGETEASIATQMKLFHERVLPTLDDNIVSGNSLIDHDFYESELIYDNEIETLKNKIRAFNWPITFSKIFERGGFDAIIGNPPYIRSQFLDKDVKSYLVRKYVAAAYQPDTFAFFINKGLDLLRDKGLLGYIVPNGILTNHFYAKLRKFILDRTAIRIIIDLKSSVFEGASVDTSIFILQREQKENIRNANHVLIGECAVKILKQVSTPTAFLDQSKFHKLQDYVFNSNINNDNHLLLEKISLSSQPLNKFFEIKNGMKIRKDFISRSMKDIRYKKFLSGSDIKAHSLNFSGKFVCYDKSLEKKFTNQAFRDESIFLSRPKILVRQVLGKDRIYACIDTQAYYVDQSVYILLPIQDVDVNFIIGILNSKLMFYFFRNTSSDRKETFPKIKGDQMASLPIR